MVAVQDINKNGQIQLKETAPMEKTNVIVIFPANHLIKSEQADHAFRKLFEEFMGSISRIIDEREELEAARNENCLLQSIP